MTLHSKRLKSTIRIIAVLLCCSSLTGCKFDYKEILESVTQLTENYETSSVTIAAQIDYDPWQYAVDKWNEVLDKIQAKDIDGIYDMFSEYDKNTNPNLRTQIEGLVECLDGEVVSIRHVGASNEYRRTRDGVVEKEAYTADSYFTTSNDTTYWMKVRVITAADEDSKLGFSGISILNSDLWSEYNREWLEWVDSEDKNKLNEPPEPEGMWNNINFYYGKNSDSPN